MTEAARYFEKAGRYQAIANGWDFQRLLDLWVPGDPYQPEPGTERYYRTKFEVAHRLQPKSILEIGVRAGYSALCFLWACPKAKYLGLDANFGGKDGWGGVKGYIEHARGLLGGFDATIEVQDTQKRPTAPSGEPGIIPGYEFWHIDGDHSYPGALNDLHFAHESRARWILLDDYDFIKDVRVAGDHFAARYGDEYDTEAVSDGGYRGNLLLTRKE